MNDHKQTLEIIGKVLIRAFWIGVGLMTLSTVLAMAMDDWAYKIHSKLFDLTRHEFDLMIYGWLGLLKMGVTLFFLIPYLAMRMVAAKL